MNNAAIFKPIKFASSGLEVKNRIFRSSISGRFDNEDGSGTQTRINWEEKFARGGVGAIISSYVPVMMEGRIMSGYATVHLDDYIPFWRRLGATVHRHDCKYIMQLSHSGRQQDVPGIVNQHRKVLSSTSRTESLHGFPCQAMTTAQVHATIPAFAQVILGRACLRARNSAGSGELRFGRRGRRHDPSRFVGCLRHGRTIHEIREIWETLSRGTRTGGNKKAPAKPGPSISRAGNKTQRE